jgi:DNA polymerase-4
MKVAFVELAGFYVACENTGAHAAVAVLRGDVCWDVSEVAYRSGARVGSTKRQAALACPGISFTGYQRGKYSEPSRRFLDVLYARSPAVEPVDFHQAFLTVGGGDGPGATPHRSDLLGLERELRGLCFMVRVGVAASKFAARAAVLRSAYPGDIQGAAVLGGSAPGGTGAGVRLSGVIVTDEGEFLRNLPVSFLWKVPEEVRNRMEALGLKRVGDLGTIPYVELVRQFGAIGREVYRLARGAGNDPVLPGYPPPEIVRRVSFENGVDSRDAIKAEIDEACRLAGQELRDTGRGAGRIRVELVLQDGRKAAASRRFLRRRWSAEALKTAAGACLDGITVTAPVEEVSVVVDELGKMEPRQMFMPLDSGERRSGYAGPDLEQVISALDDKFRKNAVFRGREFRASRREMLLSMWDPMRTGGGPN